MPSSKIKEILEKYIDYHSRCFATDGEYTDAELAKMLSEKGKREYEWTVSFLEKSLKEIEEATRREVVEVLKGMKLELPKTKCMNLVNHLSGYCFQCEKIKGHNSALSEAITKITQLDK